MKRLAALLCAIAPALVASAASAHEVGVAHAHAPTLGWIFAAAGVVGVLSLAALLPRKAVVKS